MYNYAIRNTRCTGVIILYATTGKHPRRNIETYASCFKVVVYATMVEPLGFFVAGNYLKLRCIERWRSAINS
jgi:hypothetical protein